MPLPLLPLPTTTVDVGGTQVTIRSLSRGERLALAELDLDARGIEAYIVGCCTDTPLDEAQRWLASVTSRVADGLIREAMEWSGMIAPRTPADIPGPKTDEPEDADEPEDPSSGLTEEQGSDKPSSEP